MEKSKAGKKVVAKSSKSKNNDEPQEELQTGRKSVGSKS
jgi:hypothetical protein